METIATDKQNWRDVLKDEVGRKNQIVVADELGYSTSVISQVLKDKYTGDTDKVRAKVEGMYMGSTVTCPVVGTMPRNRCIEQQGKPFAATNPTRVQMFYTCPKCPNNQTAQPRTITKEHAA